MSPSTTPSVGSPQTNENRFDAPDSNMFMEMIIDSDDSSVQNSCPGYSLACFWQEEFRKAEVLFISTDFLLSGAYPCMGGTP